MPTLNDTDQGVFFQASEIQAFFPDGGTISYSTDEIHVESRGQGREVVVLQQGDHTVRLYLIPPAQDWRSSANYTWSLSMGWMSTNNHNNNGDQWLFWNKENNVQSQIQAFSGKELFSTDSVTLHFEAMSRFPWSHKTLLPKVPNTKIVLKDVLLGAHLEENNNPLLARHRPCQSSVCDIVDGVVGSESMFGGIPIPVAEAPIDLLRLVLGLPALIVLIGLIRFAMRRQGMQQSYTPVDENEDGQELEIVNKD